jgi:hypothetical protein
LALFHLRNRWISLAADGIGFSGGLSSPLRFFLTKKDFLLLTGLKTLSKHGVTAVAPKMTASLMLSDCKDDSDSKN